MESNVKTIDKLNLRVSIATLNRVVFPHPKNGVSMLALERKATLLQDGGGQAHVRAQPFGGGVRILKTGALQTLIGPIRYDTSHSQAERDFRILIRPNDWPAVKQFCFHHLANPADTELEYGPQRELVEEFDDTLGIQLDPDQYTFSPTGFVVEDEPTLTDNAYAHGQPTVRLYHIFETRIVDSALSRIILEHNQRWSDLELGRLALQNALGGGKGRANAILVLPLSQVVAAYAILSTGQRYRPIQVEDHWLDESVLAILEGVTVPQYHRVKEDMFNRHADM